MRALVNSVQDKIESDVPSNGSFLPSRSGQSSVDADMSCGAATNPLTSVAPVGVSRAIEKSGKQCLSDKVTSPSRRSVTTDALKAKHDSKAPCSRSPTQPRHLDHASRPHRLHRT